MTSDKLKGNILGRSWACDRKDTTVVQTMEIDFSKKASSVGAFYQNSTSVESVIQIKRNNFCRNSLMNHTATGCCCCSDLWLINVGSNYFLFTLREPARIDLREADDTWLLFPLQMGNDDEAVMKDEGRGDTYCSGDIFQRSFMNKSSAEPSV